MSFKNSIVSNGASLGKNIEIGPFCNIGRNVIIENNCRLHSHVNIDGNVIIGENTEIFPFSSVRF